MSKKEGGSYPVDQIPEKFSRVLMAGMTVFSIAVFIIDIYIPLGVSGGVAYVLLVMSTFWTRGRAITRWTGVMATILLLFGFRFSVSTEYLVLSLSAANHLMMVVAIWASVWFVNNYKASINQLRRNYRTLFKATTDELLVYQIDANNHPEPFLEVNDMACELLGYTRDELLQKSMYDIVDAEKEDIHSRILNVLKSGEAIYESRHITKEGDIIPLEMSVRWFSYNGRPTMISIGRDLREHRSLEREILNISEQERLRIGQDMHDDLGQLLTVARMTAKQLEKDLISKGMSEAEELQEIVELVDKAGESARTIAHGLVPIQMESDGLDYALEELTHSMSKHYDTEIRYNGELNEMPVDSSSAVHLYRIAQEAINNAVKHANATTIDVNLYSSEDQVIMRIRDDGIGFDSDAKDSGRGLRIMKFRSNMINGRLKIKSKKGEGTEVTCRVPKRIPEPISKFEALNPKFET